MKIFIKNKKINHFSEWEQFNVEDNFFDEYVRKIDEYDFEVIDWKLIWKINVDKSRLIQEINLETREKILSSYSETDQTNLTRKVLLINSLIQYEKRDYTEDEVIILLQAKEADDFINTCIEEWKTKIKELWN